jgi:UDP-GlcNAc:undecaprenyl-phosphate GlcNAc-1-phosphate transferase
VSAIAAIFALPVAGAVILFSLRTRLTRTLLAQPSEERWHEAPTPVVGGLGIVAGLLAGAGGALAVGAIEPTAELVGILAGCLILFAAGLLDDAFSLRPATKIAAQVAATLVVLASGVRVEIVDNDALGFLIALVWFVGMTNAFNLLDNMDALAATLAAVAATYFAIDAAFVHPNSTVLVLSLSLVFACIGFLPFNLGRQRPRAVFMGDSGSQVLGFALAAFGIASTWAVAGSTFASVLVPIVVLGVPILDTGLVAVMRLREGRPIHRGGRDHTSHRLVYRGLSELTAVGVLAAIALALGATSLAYGLLDSFGVTLVGVLVTFTLLVQFVSYLAEVERGPAAATALARRPLLQRIVVNPRRLLETLLDFALVTAAFLAAYLIGVGRHGTAFQRELLVLTLPAVVAARYLAFVLFGLYRRVWRYAGARDAAAIVAAIGVSEFAAMAPVLAMNEFGEFPLTVFAVDFVLCTVLIGASRFAEHAIGGLLAGLHERSRVRRTLIVGAGRGGRSLLRDLRETPGEQVVGFVDDDPALRGRRLQGALVLGGCESIETILARARPERVFVTIPDAPHERLDAIVQACAEAGIFCRFVRRQLDLDPDVVLRAVAE